MFGLGPRPWEPEHFHLPNTTFNAYHKWFHTVHASKNPEHHAPEYYSFIQDDSDELIPAFQIVNVSATLNLSVNLWRTVKFG